MPLETLYITGTPGLIQVSHPKLAYSNVFLCRRNGKMLVETTAVPQGKYFRHNAAGALIELPADQPVEQHAIEYGPYDILQRDDFIIMIKY